MKLQSEMAADVPDATIVTNLAYDQNKSKKTSGFFVLMVLISNQK